MLFIFVECFPDVRLVCNLLGFGTDKVRHSGDKFQVCRDLKGKTNSVGIIDEDPGNVQPTYIGDLTELSRTNDIRVLSDARRKNYLIVIRPELEKWILDAAVQSNINPTDKTYNLPNNPKDLHDEISVKSGPGLKKFGKLLEDLHRSNNPRIAGLRNILNQYA